VSRQQSKERAAANRDRLRQIIDLLPQFIFAKNRDNEYILANEAIADAYGSTVDEVEGSTDADFVASAAEAEQFREDDLAVMDSGEAKHIPEEPLTKADGETVMLQTTKIPYDPVDHDSEAVLGIATDITEKAESKLQLENERDMFAEGPAVVFKWGNDDGWPVEYVSENIAETFGYTPAQLTSGAVSYTDLIHDDDLERVAMEVDEQTDGTTDRFSHEPYRMVTADGDIRWVTDNTKLLRTDGEVTHYLGYLIDITEQKRLEASLRESQESLRELTSIASETDRDFEAKLNALLELGAERLGLPYGFLNRIDGETQHVVQAVGDHPELQTGASAPKGETYCRKAVEQSTPLSIQNAVNEGWEGDPAYERFDLGCYIGGSVTVDGSFYGTLCFADRNTATTSSPTPNARSWNCWCSGSATSFRDRPSRQTSGRSTRRASSSCPFPRKSRSPLLPSKVRSRSSMSQRSASGGTTRITMHSFPN
jgi:PAS domain S-box